MNISFKNVNLSVLINCYYNMKFYYVARYMFHFWITQYMQICILLHIIGKGKDKVISERAVWGWTYDSTYS
jgi:hypothetical protein